MIRIIYSKRSVPLRLYTVLFFLLLCIGGCGTKKAAREGDIHVSSLPYDVGQRAVAKSAMVSSAHRLSSEIGKKILENGGNAVDAAVATAFAVSVVEPEMSGIGGGGGMTIWMNGSKEAYYIDHYPAKRASTYSAVDGHKENHVLWEVGIPGTVAGLLHAQEKFGKLSRKEVLEPSIRLAREGFPLYPKLAHYLMTMKDALQRYGGWSVFCPKGEAYIGEIVKQEALANTLQKIADEGSSAFYNGSIGENIVKMLNEDGIPITMSDFQNYKVWTHKIPLTTNYKKWKVLSAPPPQGGLEIIEVLNILEPYNLKEIGLPTQSPRAFQLIAGAMRAGISDRAYSIDPNWSHVPSDVLISKAYAIERTKDVSAVPVPRVISPGKIDGYFGFGTAERDKNAIDEKGETTSLSVVDAEGNAVALTQTLSTEFGKQGGWVDGFFLNNSGPDFSQSIRHPLPTPSSDYLTRYSPIAPTIILDENNTVKLVIGSPGGTRISTRIIENIIYMLDYGMDPMVAARMPSIHALSSSNGVHTQMGFDGKVYEEGRKNGYYFHVNYGAIARIYSILRKDGYWIGAADQVHQGGAAGY